LQGPGKLLKYSELLAPQPREACVRKHVYSSFYDTRLDSLLRNRGVKTLFLAGFDFSCCSLATAIDAMHRNYRVVFLRDCIATMPLPMDPHARLPYT
jgi:nicotinamidase-related amidase